jgi:hypothetical protein
MNVNNPIMEECKYGGGFLNPGGKKEDEDAGSSNSSQKSVQSSYSDMSNNSRAHMYKVEQISFVKKVNGKFGDNYDI